jgi:hypothetical protein
MGVARMVVRQVETTMITLSGRIDLISLAMRIVVVVSRRGRLEGRGRGRARAARMLLLMRRRMGVRIYTIDESIGSVIGGLH